MSDYEAALSVYRDELADWRALADDLAAALEHVGLTTWGMNPWPAKVDDVLARYRALRGSDDE